MSTFYGIKNRLWLKKIENAHFFTTARGGGGKQKQRKKKQERMKKMYQWSKPHTEVPTRSRSSNQRHRTLRTYIFRETNSLPLKIRRDSACNLFPFDTKLFLSLRISRLPTTTFSIFTVYKDKQIKANFYWSGIARPKRLETKTSLRHWFCDVWISCKFVFWY